MISLLQLDCVFTIYLVGNVISLWISVMKPSCILAIIMFCTMSA